MLSRARGILSGAQHAAICNSNTRGVLSVPNLAAHHAQAMDGAAEVQRWHRTTRRRGEAAPAPAQRGPYRFPADEGYPAPPFRNATPTGAPPPGLAFPQQPPPPMPSCRG